MSAFDGSRGMGETLRWALESAVDPATAAADWLARDIRPGCGGAVALVTDQGATIEELRAAKDVFKAMRVVGETGVDRRTAARLYAAVIAAALVHHDHRISRQSDRAVRRALTTLACDHEAPAALRSLATAGLARLG